MDKREIEDRILILGIKFNTTGIEYVYSRLEYYGGLLTVPSGPGLAEIPNDKIYYNSLLNSDLTIADSGFMVLIWNVLNKKNKINHLSGVEFIDFFVKTYPALENRKSIFLVNPSLEEDIANKLLFKGLGVSEQTINSYIAPFYKEAVVKDEILLNLLKKKKPHWVLLNIAGGKQEKLGSWLKDNLDYKPAIICTGAAIAFKTGMQAKLPVWVVNIYMGWLFRIISNPRKYFIRYFKAFNLFGLLLKYREKEYEYN